jgi:CheY-like chemotaxis protein
MVQPARMGWHEGEGSGRTRWWVRRPGRPGKTRPRRPAPRVAVARRQAAPLTGKTPGNGVLIVEADAFARDTLAKLLRGRGYAADTAASGREALRRLGSPLLPALILLDLRLLDGWEFCRRCQRDPRLAGIPIVVLTAGEPLPPDKVAALGVAGHLQKPIVLDDLLHTIDRLY